MTPRKKRLAPWFRGKAALGILAAVAIVLIGGFTTGTALLARGGASADVFPTPTPARTVGAIGAHSSPQNGPPGSGPASWMVMPPALAGHTVHWTQVSYSYRATSPDPANGQLVTGSVWEQISDDGVPVVFFATYTLPDGALLQQILQTRNGITVSFGSAYPDNANICGPSSQPVSVAQMRATLPPFADVSALASQGFGKTLLKAGIASIPPSQVVLQGVAPIQTYSSSGPVDSWVERTGLPGNMAAVTTIAVGAQGRVINEDSQTISGSGSVISETRTTFGALQVYTSTSVPTSIFPTRLGGACNG